MSRGLMFALLVLFAGHVSAAVDRDTRIDVNGQFATQQQTILASLEDSESYSEISNEDKGNVKDALARISSVLKQSGGVESLGQEQKIQIFNDQELANAILTKAGSDSRMVCKRVVKTGSHRGTTQCLTVAERRRALEHAQDDLRHTPPHQMKDPMGG